MSDPLKSLEAMASDTKEVLRENAALRQDLGLDESDLSDATQARPEDVADRTFPAETWPFRSGHVYALEGGGFMQWGTEVAAAMAPPAPAYVISDEEGLRRAFGAIRHARRRLEQNKRMQAPEVEALERELFMLKEANARANKALEEEIAHKERAITVYAQLRRKDVLGSETPREGETKTRNYGIGKISYRKAGGEYRWRQDMTPREREEALMEWARAEEDVTGEILTRSEPRPNLDAIKAHLEALGADERAESIGNNVAPPGLEWVEPGENIVVKVVGEEK